MALGSLVNFSPGVKHKRLKSPSLSINTDVFDDGRIPTDVHNESDSGDTVDDPK
jgi:hypothetical protein